jgi:hypothetical protein
MNRYALLTISIGLSSCQPDQSQTDKQSREPERYTFDRSQSYTLAPLIPENDQWLESFKKTWKYGDGWETWVWRKTDIDFAEGAVVYARDEDEVQFFITGFRAVTNYGDQFGELTIDFRHGMIGWSFGNSGMHVEAFSPSKDYYVVITRNPRSFVSSGMPLTER